MGGVWWWWRERIKEESGRRQNVYNSRAESKRGEDRQL